jgi:hypothetical protein
MFDFWFQSSPLARAVLGLFLMGLAAVLFLLNGRIAVGIGAVGLVMVLFCWAGGSGNGYNF